MRVSSSLSFGSEGAASVRESFRSFILRARSAGSFTLSKRVACLAYATVAAITRSLACAARISVSSVMNVDWTQLARPASVESARSFVSASSRNAFAPATVAAAGLPAGGAFLAGTAKRKAGTRRTPVRERMQLRFILHSKFSSTRRL